MQKELVSIDIGSTYTKGALFTLASLEHREGKSCAKLILKKRAAVPTTQEDLSLGFGRVYTELTGLPFPTFRDTGIQDIPQEKNKEAIQSLGTQGPGFAAGQHLKEEKSPNEALGSAEKPRHLDIYFSSSAKGGLRIAAVGIVPDLTLQIARLAAWSAGGKIVADSSYRLREDSLQRLLAGDPDILLFTGGTDGGNEDMVLWNARQLAGSSFKGTILYAGNSAIQREVRKILENKCLVVASNVMPRVGEICIEETRRTIQKIFLDTIVEGRGLKLVQEFCQTEPVPTPAAVFNLVEALGSEGALEEPFCVIDLGGATTDVYSVGEPFLGGEGVVLKGLREPKVKRTVEGDLGMRVSAFALWDTIHSILPEIKTLFAPLGCPDQEELQAYVEKVTKNPSYIPETKAEETLDRFLALLAVALAVVRHSGVWEESYTPAGKIYLQSGKDLRPSKILIGSGGYLCRYSLGRVIRTLLRGMQEGKVRGNPLSSVLQRGGIPLVPYQAQYFRDSFYLFPLLGNFVKEYPKEGIQMALETLCLESEEA
ncbi:MAG: glutamate mutase L [Spirochaetales bacterium]